MTTTQTRPPGGTSGEGQRIARVGEQHALEPSAHRAAADEVAREGAEVTERRSQTALAAQDMASAAVNRGQPA